MFKLDLEKAEEPQSNCQHPLDRRKSKRIPEKSISVAFFILKPLCGSQQALENSSGDENTRPPYLPPEKSACRSRNDS